MSPTSSDDSPHSDAIARLRRADLNLLVPFEALVSERSVTGAADRLGLGQSAMSSTLVRIRTLFKDPILVRRGRQMVTTPLADSLLGPVSEILADLESLVGSDAPFDPNVDERVFTIMVSDYSAVGVLQPLLADISRAMPRIRVHITALSSEAPSALLRRKVDLVILPREALSTFSALWGEDVRREVFYRDRFVLAADAANPSVRASTTVEQFSKMPYLASTFIDGQQSLVDANLDMLGIPRRIEVTTGLSVGPFMLRRTRLVTLVPHVLAIRVADAANIQFVDPPMQLQPIVEMLVWRARDEHDAALTWFIERLRSHADNLMATASH